MTETEQPDPQVVACPTCAALPGERCTVEDGRTPSLDHTSRYSLAERVAMRAARKPLAPGDVPAGQGPASLHITSTGGRPALWFKADDGGLHFIRWAAGPGDTPAARALWDHLAATITHVTTKETP